MIVLVLGAGQVAQAVAATCPSSAELISRPRTQLDIVDADAVRRAITDIRPDWIVNAAAYTAVDLAEDRPEEAKAVNATAVGVLAEAAAANHCRLFHLSTDFVFDGTSSIAYRPEDLTHPLSVYGATKLSGELYVVNSKSPGVVLRTSWVYAAKGKNFVLTMLRLMREKDRLSVVCDQIGCPTWASGLGAAIWGLIQARATAGTYHWSDLGVASWYDFAVAIQDEALARGLLNRPIPIDPISSAAYPTPARRPAFSLLDISSTRALVAVPAQHWRHNLRTMLDELRAS